MPYVALEAITIQSLNMIPANEEAQTRPYQYYVTVCLSVPPTKQFWEGLVITVQRFVCLSVAMTTSQGNGYGTQSIGNVGSLYKRKKNIGESVSSGDWYIELGYIA